MGNLNRFVTAQNEVYDDVIRELKNGEKVSHWMWYVIPQIAGCNGKFQPMEIYILGRGFI
jgi:uncharacterized protein (DUF1810 family)